MSTAAPWFNNAVISGVQMLYSLSLQGCPAGEVLQLTTLTWIDALWRARFWDEPVDTRRLDVAFASLAAAVERWPAPRQLLNYLPPRPAVLQLPEPQAPVSPARQAQMAAARRSVTEWSLGARLAGNRQGAPRNSGDQFAPASDTMCQADDGATDANADANFSGRSMS